jgi:hypothetical protein
MATRTVTRFVAHFDDDGNLAKLEAPARIDTEEIFTNAQGKSVTVVEWESYTVNASDLPPAFVANLETVHGQIVAKLDELF